MGVRLLTFGGILLIFGGRIIIYIFVGVTRLACLFLFLFFGPSVSSAFWANKNCVKGAEITTTKLCNKETNGNGNDSTELKNFHLKGMCEEKNKLLIFLSPLHKVP